VLGFLDPGSAAGWLTLLALIGTAVLIWRGGGGTALSTLQEANRVLERRVRELERLHAADGEMIAELKGRTDVTLALAPIVEWSGRHEERAQQRHDATLGVLGLIADRLGPDNGRQAAA
jgi:hypothetical protein